MLVIGAKLKWAMTKEGGRGMYYNNKMTVAR